MWVIGGIGSSIYNDIWSSVDGVTWTLENGSPAFSTRFGHNCLVYNNRMWVSGGYHSTNPAANADNEVWSSADGITWTQENASPVFAPRGYPSSVVYNQAMWVIGRRASIGNYFADVWNLSI